MQNIWYFDNLGILSQTSNSCLLPVKIPSFHYPEMLKSQYRHNVFLRRMFYMDIRFIIIANVNANIKHPLEYEFEHWIKLTVFLWISLLIVIVNSSSTWKITVSTTLTFTLITFLFVRMQALRLKQNLMWGAIKHFFEKVTRPREF